MKNLFTSPLLLVYIIFFSSILYAQERTVTGTVTTLENIAIVKAEVKVLSSKVTVLTDSVGNFKVSCLVNDKIKISAKGFSSQKVKIDEKTKEIKINLIFKPGKKSIDVAMGYGHINEKDKSYAITSLKNDDKYGFSKYSNIIDAIVNISPSITYSGGGITIRGEGSLHGSNHALILIDGMESNMSQLSALPPSDVESIDILKGGSASIYGVRGANGVVLITTKKGRDN
ncbi:TonB-dependent receptor plug domain-containing protein [Geojedonia litorea]|uniref:TonB-dependent receptor plug domain-containing protein n=1 Tax=Geojedonia litorea TaxID=1268269 RepID=A0ABV9MYD4_9FLAO